MNPPRPYIRRERQDSVEQAFYREKMAELVAEIGERITGEPHDVVSKGLGWHLVIRTTFDGKEFRV